MNEEIRWLVSSGFRLFLFCGVNQLGVIFFSRKLMDCRRSMRLFWLYSIIGRILFYNLLCQHVLQHYFKDENWFRVFFPCVVLAMAIMSYAVFYHTFEGEFLRVALAGMCADWVITITGFFSLCIVNFLEKRPSSAVLIDVFQWPDLMIALLQWSVLYLLVHFLNPLLKRFKQTSMRHRKLLWTILCCYFVTASCTVFLNNKIATGVFIYILFSSFCFCSVLLIVVWRYRRGITAEQKLLNIQLNAIEFHYSAVQGQIRKMENSRREIEKQMKEIVRLEQSSAADRKIVEYLKRLKTEYEETCAGVYCDDWLVDAVLCYHSEKFHRKGILFDCSMQGYKKGLIDERDLIRMYLILLDWGFQAGKTAAETEEKRIYLHTSAVRNQLIIEFFCSCTEKNRAPVKTIRRYIKKYEGTVKIRKEQAGTGIILALQNG